MILDDIRAFTERLVEDRKRMAPQALLEARIEGLPEPRDFRHALRKPGMSLIAEVKKASPSKGQLLGDDINIVELAEFYEMDGASAISVLTEPEFFKGAPEYLTTIHHEVKIPCLRKDFIIDVYQVYESRAIQADAILLIVRMLTDKQLQEYIELASSLGMAALVETHNSEDIKRARDAGAHIIGINNRDLATFETSLETTMTLKREVPGGYILVSESGIHTPEDVKLLDDCGIDAVLVGEALVTSNDIRGKLRELLSHAG